MNLQGKIAIITGASRGIGRAIAVRLAKDGALAVVNYQANAEAAAAVVKEITASGGEAFAVQGDMGRVEQIRDFFQSVDAELGKRRGSKQFDILVNNAGIGRQGTVESTTESVFDEVFAVNVKGPFFVAQEAIPRLRDGGRVVNISSALSRHPMQEMAAYSMGKAALDLLTVLLAGQLGRRGITVNTVAPGLIATDATAYTLQNSQLVQVITSHTALRRIGEVQDIADAVAFLASDDARWVTGQYIEASGGAGLV